MFLEPFQHILSLMTLSIVLLEHFISTWEDRCHAWLNCSAMMYRYSVTFKVSIPQLRVPETIKRMSPKAYCHHRPVYDLQHIEGPLPERQHILTQPSAWWMTNHDSSNQVQLDESRFHWSMVQSLCSRAQHRCSWQWHLISRGRWMGHPLRSPISNNVHWTVCSDTFLLGLTLY